MRRCLTWSVSPKPQEPHRSCHQSVYPQCTCLGDGLAERQVSALIYDALLCLGICLISVSNLPDIMESHVKNYEFWCPVLLSVGIQDTTIPCCRWVIQGVRILALKQSSPVCVFVKKFSPSQLVSRGMAELSAIHTLVHPHSFLVGAIYSASWSWHSRKLMWSGNKGSLIMLPCQWCCSWIWLLSWEKCVLILPLRCTVCTWVI